MEREPTPPPAYTLTLLTGLYVAQGIPYGFFTQALPVLLRDAGLSLKAISLTSLLFLPWTLKFLWGPAVDRIGTPRAWLLPLQLASAAGAALLSCVDLQQGFAMLFAAFFLFNLLASLQDVVTDSLAVRMLDDRQRGLANGIQVGAYRIGMVLGGGLLLYVYARAGWRPMFVAMSALLLLCSLPVPWLRVAAAAPAARLSAKTLASGWWLRLRQPGVIGFVLLIAAYKFGDTMAASLIGPFMRDWGLSKEAIALLKGTVGSTAGFAGAAAGGWAAWRFGRRFALLAFGLTQTAGIALYGLAAMHAGGIGMLWAACVAEHLFGGMATVALFTLMMDASDREHAGTDYSLYACAIVLAQGLAAFAGGVIGDAAGYVASFAVAALLSGLGCALLVMRLDRGAGPRLLDAVWPRRPRIAATTMPA
jgi:MFS family permease